MVGASLTVDLTLFNAGTGPLTLEPGSLTFDSPGFPTGPCSAPDFSIDYQSPSGALTLAAGASQVAKLTIHGLTGCGATPLPPMPFFLRLMKHTTPGASSDTDLPISFMNGTFLPQSPKVGLTVSYGSPATNVSENSIVPMSGNTIVLQLGKTGMGALVALNVAFSDLAYSLSMATPPIPLPDGGSVPITITRRAGAGPTTVRIFSADAVNQRPSVLTFTLQ
jgi:hypothetical protein